MTHAGWDVIIVEPQILVWSNANEAGCDGCADTMGFRYHRPLSAIQPVFFPLSRRVFCGTLTISGICSNVCHDIRLSGSGSTFSSSALSLSKQSGLLSRWKVKTANVCAVVSPPAPIRMNASSMSLSIVFSCGGRSLSRNSSKMVLCAFSGSRFRAKTFSTCLRTSYFHFSCQSSGERGSQSN